MGQQVRFETIDLLARALSRDEHRRTGQPVPAVPRLVQLGSEALWRVELELTGPDGTRHPVHVYEAYWAPLTQGKITLAETVRLLIGAGVDGVRYGLLPPRVLPRYLFGRWVRFPLRPGLAALFLLLLLDVLALVAVNLTMTATLAVRLLNGNGSTAWPSDSLLGDLTVDFAWLAASFLITGAALGLAYVSQRRNWRDSAPATRHAVPQAIIWALIGVTLAGIAAVGGLVVFHLVAHFVADRPAWSWQPSWWCAAAVWAVVMAGSAVVRWFLIEFIGDTGIYVSSHRVNRFFETRQAIRDASHSVTAAIYQFGGYERHILVGHSLGSAIAYDTFNRMVNDDSLRTQPLEVARRTALFLSFGSVLDKTAFLFRVQTTDCDIREMLAAATQPMISEAAARPRWINIYSPHDPLGGSLEYYDPPGEPGTGAVGGPLPAPVSNVQDPDAWIPLIAHVQYWTNHTFVETLVAAVTARTATRGAGPE